MRRFPLLVLALLWMGADRPHDPWVFRSILDGRARMVTAALDDELWVSYDPKFCAPYRIWKGGVKFQGAVYSAGLLNRNATPETRGDFYYTDQGIDPWQARRGNQSLETAASFAGYRLQGADGTEGVTLMYALSVGGSTVSIEETPRVIDGAASSPKGLLRRFEVSGLPADTLLALRVSGGGLTTVLEASGEADVVVRDGERWLEFTSDGTSSLRMTFSRAAASTSPR